MCSNQINHFLLHNTVCIIINLDLGEKRVVESVCELLIKMPVLTISKGRWSHAKILNYDHETLFNFVFFSSTLILPQAFN